MKKIFVALLITLIMPVSILFAFDWKWIGGVPVILFQSINSHYTMDIVQSASSDSSKYVVIDTPVLDTSGERQSLNETILVGKSIRLKYNIQLRENSSVKKVLKSALNFFYYKNPPKNEMGVYVPSGIELTSIKGCKKSEEPKDYYSFEGEPMTFYCFEFDEKNKTEMVFEFNFEPKHTGNYHIEFRTPYNEIPVIYTLIVK